jgi:hypothetical protein
MIQLERMVVKALCAHGAKTENATPKEDSPAGKCPFAR